MKLFSQDSNSTGPWITQATLVILLAMLAFFGVGCSKESKISRHATKADEFYATGDYDKARLEYLAVAKLDPKNTHAIAQLGHIYFEDGVLILATQAYNTAIELGTKDPRVFARMGTLLAGAKKFDAARENARKALAMDPTLEDAVFLLTDLVNDQTSAEAFKKELNQLRAQQGNLPIYDAAEAVTALKLRNPSEALSLATKAAKSAPDLAAAQFVLAGVYLSQSNITAGEAALAKSAELSPPRSTRQLQYINFLAQRGSTNEAQAALDKLIKEAPDYVPARLREAQVAFVAKDYKKVDQELNAILTRDPINIDARVMQAQLALANHEPDQAGTIMDQVISQFGNSPQLQYQAALVSLANRNPAQALIRVDRAYELDPNSPQIILLRGKLYLARGQSAEAVNFLQRYISTNAMVRPVYQLLGEAYLSRGEWDRAVQVFQDYERRFTDDPVGPMSLGVIRLANKDEPKARTAFEKALSLQSDYIPAVAQLVSLDLAVSNTAPAIARAQKLVDQLPKSPQAHALLGGAQLKAKDYKSGEAELKKAIELDPDYQPAYLDLAKFYDDSDRRESAISSLKQLLENKPDDLRALMQLAVIYGEGGNNEEAAATYERMLKVNDSSGAALNNLAYLYSEKLNKLDRAYELARKSRDLQPNNPSIADTLGWILYHRGEYSQALVYLEESAGKLSQNAEVQYHVGMAHYAMGHESQARAALHLAVRLEPKAEWRKQADERLDVLDANVTESNPKALKQLEQFESAHKSDVILLSRLGRAQEAAQDWNAAMNTYKQAQAANPEAVTPLIGQARVAAAQGNSSEALNIARKARDLVKNDPANLHEIGRIAYVAGDYSWSYALMQDSLSGSGNDPQAQFAFAQAAIAVGRLAAAKDALKKVTDSARAEVQLKLIDYCQNGNPVPLSAEAKQLLAATQPGELLADYLKARSRAVEGDADGAVSGLDELLKKYPQFLPAKRTLAMMLADRPDGADRAEKLAREVRQVDVNDPEMAKVLGQVAFSRKDYRYAGDMLQEASRNLGSDGELFLLLGRSRAETKQVADARQAINKALSLQLTDAQKRAAQKLLQQLK